MYAKNTFYAEQFYSVCIYSKKTNFFFWRGEIYQLRNVLVFSISEFNNFENFEIYYYITGENAALQIKSSSKNRKKKTIILLWYSQNNLVSTQIISVRTTLKTYISRLRSNIDCRNNIKLLKS